MLADNLDVILSQSGNLRELFNGKLTLVKFRHRPVFVTPFGLEASHGKTVRFAPPDFMRRGNCLAGARVSWSGKGTRCPTYKPTKRRRL